MSRNTFVSLLFIVLVISCSGCSNFASVSSNRVPAAVATFRDNMAFPEFEITPGSVVRFREDLVFFRMPDSHLSRIFVGDGSISNGLGASLISNQKNPERSREKYLAIFKVVGPNQTDGYLLRAGSSMEVASVSEYTLDEEVAVSAKYKVITSIVLIDKDGNLLEVKYSGRRSSSSFYSALYDFMLVSNRLSNFKEIGQN